MELYVKDIEKIWSSGGASLVAGKNGIMRKVESYDMMAVSYTHLTLPTT